MTKRSRHEREMRVVENDKLKAVEAQWNAAIPADVASAFAREVEAVRARGPLPPRPDMEPGTLPNPPRPGREPKPVKEERKPRRGSY